MQGLADHGQELGLDSQSHGGPQKVFKRYETSMPLQVAEDSDV